MDDGWRRYVRSMIQRRMLQLSTLVATLLVATATAAAATEAPEGKIQLFDPSNPHEVVGVLLLGVVAVAALAAVANAIKQLAGRRGQADGKFRWR